MSYNSKWANLIVIGILEAIQWFALIYMMVSPVFLIGWAQHKNLPTWQRHLPLAQGRHRQIMTQSHVQTAKPLGELENEFFNTDWKKLKIQLISGHSLLLGKCSRLRILSFLKRYWNIMHSWRTHYRNSWLCSHQSQHQAR